MEAALSEDGEIDTYLHRRAFSPIASTFRAGANATQQKRRQSISFFNVPTSTKPESAFVTLQINLLEKQKTKHFCALAIIRSCAPST